MSFLDFGASTRQGSGFWSGERIEARLSEIIVGGTRTMIDKSSYKLTVGEELYVTPARETDPRYRTMRKLAQGEATEIPPGQFALLTTEETVRVPHDAIAFITTRSKATKFRGLVNVSGFVVDPGYDGKLIFAMFNAGPATIHVKRGDEWFAILFADLDRRSTKVRNGDFYKGLPSDHITPLANELLTPQGLKASIRETRDELDQRITKVERDNAIARWAFALLLSFALTFTVKSCTDGPQKSGPAATTAQNG